MGTPKDSERTRAKIIEAAGQLFAEKGFKGVTVRDIARQAGSHLGALNYHFRSKEALYREVLLRACEDASISPEDRERLLQLKPKEALRALIGEWLNEYRDHVGSNWQSEVITRECRDPTSVFAEIAEVYLKPQADFIAQVIGKVVDKPRDNFRVRFSVIGLIGMLDTFGMYGRFVDSVAPGLAEYLQKEDLLADELVRVVLDTASFEGKEGGGVDRFS